MFSFRKRLTVPAAAEALPGRAAPIATAERHYVSGQALKGPYPAGLETAVFGLGCFWGAERRFWQVPGVHVTAVGYAGGTTPNPTYEEACSGMTGHTEAVLVVFDPSVVSYAELLRVFFESHDPTQGMRQGNDVGTQYRSAIYATSDAQLEAARAAAGDYGRALQATGHHGDCTGGTVLFRRGLPPAVPGQESGGLLRPRRHRRELPGGPDARRLRQAQNQTTGRRGDPRRSQGGNADD